MDEQTKNFNLEIILFLKNLRRFASIDTEMNNLTATLLAEAVSCIEELFENGKFNGLPSSAKDCDENDLLCNLNEEEFQWQHLITCRLCHIPILLSHEAYDAHVQSKFHQMNLRGSKESTTDAQNSSPLSHRLKSVLQCLLKDDKQESNAAAGAQIKMDDLTNSVPNSTEETKANIFNPSSDNTNVLLLKKKTVVQNAFQPDRMKGLKKATTQSPISSTNNITQFLTTKQKLTDIFKNNVFTKNISKNKAELDVVDRTSPKIIHILRSVLGDYYLGVDLVLFGSRIYGLGLPTSNLNILIDCSKCLHSADSIASLLEMLFITKLANSFDVIKTTSSITSKKSKSNVKCLHKESSIECSLLIDDDKSVLESTKLLNEFLARQPVCRYMVAFLKIWQQTANEASEMGPIQFNTYIMAHLVIVRFQILNLLPTVSSLLVEKESDVKLQSSKLSTSTKDIRAYLLDFFSFYSNTFKSALLILSPHTGKIQEKCHYLNSTAKMQGNKPFSLQKHFSAAQLSLKTVINSNPTQWKGEKICVQDMGNPETNTTANLSKDEIIAFKKCCELSAKILREEGTIAPSRQAVTNQ